MIVSFYSIVKEYTNGESTYTPQLKANLTLRDMLDELCSNYGQRFKSFIHGNDTCLILINGNGIALTGGLDSPLKQGDKVDILPFIEAG